MASQTLEERLSAVELELQNIKQLLTASQLDTVRRNSDWRRHVEGSMADLEGFDEMVRLGREWRQSETIEEYNARMDDGV